MPIKGLFRDQSPITSLREVGQIRLGRTVERNGRRIPEKLPGFQLSKKDDTGAWIRDEEAHRRIARRAGVDPKDVPYPRDLKVWLPSDDPDECLVTSLSLYRSSGKGRFCSGDNERAHVSIFPGDMCAFNKEGKFEVYRLFKDR